MVSRGATLVTGVAALALLLSANACRDGENGSAEAVITDRAGRRWDVTHARERYGMNPEYFNFGLGVGAIPSVDTPRYISEGESGYPERGDLDVFGLAYQGTHRAYAVGELTRHEVFNEKFPGDTLNYAAVAY